MWSANKVRSDTLTLRSDGKDRLKLEKFAVADGCHGDLVAGLIGSEDVGEGVILIEDVFVDFQEDVTLANADFLCGRSLEHFLDEEAGFE